MEEELQEFLNKMRKIQNSLLFLIDNEDNTEENHQNLLTILNEYKIEEDPHTFKMFLYLISAISNNHYRSPNFFSKFEKILNKYKTQIKNTFSDFDIFLIFKKNKRFLLFFLQENFIKLDESIFSYMTKSDNEFLYCDYFSKELRPFINPIFDIDNSDDIDDEKRKIGETDLEVCNLIRKDSVEEFESYTTKYQLNLKMTIEPTIYETNPYLYLKEPTLIEYAAFFGSIKIFKYLIQNKIQLTPSLWNFAIHGNNLDLIHILEENNVKHEFDFFEFSLKEALKCHHNKIANYINENLIQDKNYTLFNQIFGYTDNILGYCFHYYNFDFFPDNFINKFTFYYSCQYDYFNFVEILLKLQKIDLNSSIILFVKFV